MFSEVEYLNGWLAYNVGAIVGLACWFYLIRKLPVKLIKAALFGAMLGLLIMPWPIAEESEYLAPAWIIAGAEGVFEGLEAFWRAGQPMLLAVLFFTCAAAITQAILSYVKKSKSLMS